MSDFITMMVLLALTVIGAIVLIVATRAKYASGCRCGELDIHGVNGCTGKDYNLTRVAALMTTLSCGWAFIVLLAFSY